MDSREKHRSTYSPSEHWTDYNTSYNIQRQSTQNSQNIPEYFSHSFQGGLSVTNGVSGTDGCGSNHLRFYRSTNIEDPSYALQLPSLVHPTATRVHINPNYRPPPQLIPEQNSASRRPTNVHVNPRWKGRLELAPTSTAVDRSSANSNHGPSKKKTIFINPKVLAQHKMDVKSIPNSWFQEPVQTKCSSQELQTHVEINTKDTRDTLLDTKSEVAGQRTVKGGVIAVSTPQPVFLSVSSTKLIRRPSPILDQNHPNINEKITEWSHAATSLESKIDNIHARPSSTNNHSLKVAKQVCSKYKLVRNPPSSSVSSDLLRKMRRKSFNAKLPMVPSIKSAYKFVRKAALQEQEPSSLLDKGYTPISCLNQGMLKEAKGQRIMRRNIKTRFKLVKIQAHQGASVSPGTSQTKTVKTRFKLVRRNLPDGKTPTVTLPKSQLTSSVRNVPYHSPFLKSRYNLSQSAVGSKLKLSRFRVVHASNTSKLRPKYCATHKIVRKTPQSLCVNSPFVRRQGLYGNRIWRKEVSMIAAPLKAFQHTYQSNLRKEKCFTSSSNKTSCRRLLNIGGVFYRSTPTSLTRTNSAKPKERIVHIRGKRFILDVKGTTLRPAPHPENSSNKIRNRRGQLSIARVDLGGVTYTRRSDNTLVRTNLHHARNILSNAKIRSIALLTGKLRKNNQPCLIFHRFGKCRSHEEGKCWRLHDPKNIAICRKFLQGVCDSDKCPLSHNVGLEKMPTCRFFLEGCCVRDNCPYLHVKLSAGAPICSQFLDGYCSAADKCKKRHVYLCPSFDRDGKCSKGKRCPYPHKTKSKEQPLKETKNQSRSEGKVEDQKLPCHGDAEKRKRYYDRNSFGDQSQNPGNSNPGQGPLESKTLPPDGSVHSEESVVPLQEEETEGRQAIGILPAYIPLE